MLRAVHYINQFFGQIGGEDLADFEPVLRDGVVGPGRIFAETLKDVTITHTIICGDNFMASHTEEALARIEKMLAGLEFDLFLAGPAFLAGRYGTACGEVGRMVGAKFGVPVVTSMNEENPGVELFRKHMYIFRGGHRATVVKEDVAKMASFADRLARGERLLPASVEGYFPRGVRHEIFLSDMGREPVMAADRVVDMLLAKLAGKPYVTELPIPKQDRVAIAPAVVDLRSVKLAIVTSGGIVPKDNPDRIQSCSATKWGEYDISKLDRGFTAPDYKTIHAGYDPEQANRNPNVVVPLDAIRAYQREGRLGVVDDHFYTTVGTGTTQGEAARMAREIVERLKERDVGAVLLTAT